MRHGTEKAKRPGGNRGVSETTSSEEIMAKHIPRSAVVNTAVDGVSSSPADRLAAILAQGGVARRYPTRVGRPDDDPRLVRLARLISSKIDVLVGA